MRILRWGLLALYAALILGLGVIAVWPNGSGGFLIVLLIAIASQVVFILGAGHKDLCRPIRRPRLLLPVTMAALMLGLLVSGLTLALAESLEIVQSDLTPVLFWGCFAANWVFWFVLLFVYTRDLDRYRVIHRLASLVFAGSLAELLAAVPSHIIVLRRTGCFVGISTLIGLLAGLGVMVWAFGPAILLLFLQQARRQQADPGTFRDRAPGSQRRDYQFQLRTLLLLTVALSIALGLLKSLWGQWLGLSIASAMIVYLTSAVLMRIPILLILATIAVHAGIVWLAWSEGDVLSRCLIVPVILLSAPVVWFFARSQPGAGGSAGESDSTRID